MKLRVIAAVLFSLVPFFVLAQNEEKNRDIEKKHLDERFAEESLFHEEVRGIDEAELLFIYQRVQPPESSERVRIIDFEITKFRDGSTTCYILQDADNGDSISCVKGGSLF